MRLWPGTIYTFKESTANLDAVRLILIKAIKRYQKFIFSFTFSS